MHFFIFTLYANKHTQLETLNLECIMLLGWLWDGFYLLPLFKSTKNPIMSTARWLLWIKFWEIISVFLCVCLIKLCAVILWIYQYCDFIY